MGKKKEKKKLRKARRYVRGLETKARKNRALYIQNPAPDSLHDFRVAVRSLRAALRLLRPVLGRSNADQRRDELAQIAEPTNAIRDLDIFSELSKKFHGQKKLQRALDTQKKEQRAKLQKVLSRKAVPRIPLGFPTRGKSARKVRSSFRKELKRARSILAETDLGVLEPSRAHQIRIRAKNLRYELEAFGPVFGHGRRGRKLRDEAEKTQSLLGDLHDVDMAIQRSRRKHPSLLPALSKRRKQLEKAARCEIARFSLKLAALR